MRDLKKLYITVKEVRGQCPVYEKGDTIVINGPEINLEETDKICTHAFSALLHYVPALQNGVDPRDLGLSKKKGHAYIQCLDPGSPYTEGGTVIFMVKTQEE